MQRTDNLEHYDGRFIKPRKPAPPGPRPLPEFGEREYRFFLWQGHPRELTLAQAAGLVAKFDRKHAEEFLAAAAEWDAQPNAAE